MVGEPLEDSTVGVGLAVSALLSEVYKEGAAIGSEMTDTPEADATPTRIALRKRNQCRIKGIHASIRADAP